MQWLYLLQRNLKKESELHFDFIFRNMLIALRIVTFEVFLCESDKLSYEISMVNYGYAWSLRCLLRFDNHDIGQFLSGQTWQVYIVQ